MDEMYLQILWEAFVSNTLWRFISDIRFFAIGWFGDTPMAVPTLLAIIGGTCGVLVNFFAGWLMTEYWKKGTFQLPQKTFDAGHKWTTLLVPVLGLFSWVFLVNALIVAAGFFRVDIRRAIPSFLAGQAVYYGYYYFQFLS